MSDATSDSLPDQDTGDEVLSQLPTASEPSGADGADADDVLDDADSDTPDAD